MCATDSSRLPAAQLVERSETETEAETEAETESETETDPETQAETRGCRAGGKGALLPADRLALSERASWREQGWSAPD
jgi:hypothetical protein